MANYYMLGGDGKEYGPVSPEQLRQWAAEGRANAQTQIRATDGVGYVAFGTVPELTAAPTLLLGIPPSPTAVVQQAKFFPSAQSTEEADPSAQTKRLASVVAAGAVWMKLLAVMMFLLTLLLCITVVGLLLAWLPLWQGITLWSSANLAKQAVYTGSEHDLMQALDKIRRSFMIGVILVVVLVIFYLIVTAIGTMMMGGMNALQGLGGGSL